MCTDGMTMVDPTGVKTRLVFRTLLDYDIYRFGESVMIYRLSVLYRCLGLNWPHSLQLEHKPQIHHAYRPCKLVAYICKPPAQTSYAWASLAPVPQCPCDRCGGRVTQLGSCRTLHGRLDLPGLALSDSRTDDAYLKKSVSYIRCADD